MFDNELRDNETRELIRNFLNGELTKEELASKFNIEKCECGNYDLEEDLTETEGMTHGGIGKVCEQCIEDKDIH